jgi:glycosyltransferase involved in cell wall biosynthesis
VKISVIIPVYNEAENIGLLVQSIIQHGNEQLAEIIASDGGSTDNTLNIASAAGAKVVLSPQKGRAAQMNHAASIATGDILYFVHADVQLHPDFIRQIEEAIQSGCDLGCYRYRFDSPKKMLWFNGYMTRLMVAGRVGATKPCLLKRMYLKVLAVTAANTGLWKILTW